MREGEPRRVEGLLARLEGLEKEARQETRVLLEQLEALEEVRDPATLARRWEQVEAILGALRLAQALLVEEDEEETKRVGRQVRRWRRQEGRAGNVGWMEIREVNGYGPYVYYRYRREEEGEPGKQVIHTEYYGRLDRLGKRLTEELLEREQQEP